MIRDAVRVTPAASPSPAASPVAPAEPLPLPAPTPTPAPAPTAAPAAMPPPNPSLRLDASLALVVIEFRDAGGRVTQSIPSPRELDAYRSNDGEREAPPPPPPRLDLTG